MGRMFEVRKASMFARYDRMAKQFTRVGKEIVIAVKAGGPDPDTNPSLRRAMQNAKAVNMPKDKVEGAIKRALGKDTSNYDEEIYEGYAPNGIAIMVETATDNINRTVANVRAAFSKTGGSLSTSGSVSFQFNRMGVFHLNPEGIDADEMELELIDAGLEELGEGMTEDDKESIVLRCAFEEFGNLQAALEERNIEPISSGLEWIATNTVELPEDQAEEALKCIARLEEDEDVQRVFHNLA